MDYSLLVPIITIGGVIFAIISNYVNIQKSQRESKDKDAIKAKNDGAKEEQDKNRDKEIKALWDKITEMDDIKKELTEVKHSVDMMVQKNETANMRLAEKLDLLTQAIHDHLKESK